MNPLTALAERGQSVWIDYIHRTSLHDGTLAAQVADGVRGVTSNPSIFEQAVAGSDAYDEQLAELVAARPGAASEELFEALAVTDIQAAADILRGVYDASNGGDGYVSLEVSPRLAADTTATVAEARRLWDAVDRPNLMIKVPATPEGVPAIEELIAAGINVNVTLIFSVAHYEAIADAYLAGVERLGHPGRIASVASFFVSRVDSNVDSRLSEIGGDTAARLMGKAAIANSKAAYQRFLELFPADATLPAQRVLWGSTSTKNPEYPDTMYVDELIGPRTVNTIPPATLEAFADHGTVRGDTVLEDVAEAFAFLDELAAVGIDMAEVTDELQVAGVDAFADAYERVLAAVTAKVAQLRTTAAPGR
jgi:transaldolase